jgi:hypothetical protein
MLGMARSRTLQNKLTSFIVEVVVMELKEPKETTLTSTKTRMEAVEEQYKMQAPMVTRATLDPRITYRRKQRVMEPITKNAFEMRVSFPML